MPTRIAGTTMPWRPAVPDRVPGAPEWRIRLLRRTAAGIREIQIDAADTVMVGIFGGAGVVFQRLSGNGNAWIADARADP